MMQQKGITLVSLVITIIVLLILAGISIAQLTGSGLFSKTKNAVSSQNIAMEKEAIETFHKFDISNVINIFKIIF